MLNSLKQLNVYNRSVMPNTLDYFISFVICLILSTLFHQIHRHFKDKNAVNPEQKNYLKE